MRIDEAVPMLTCPLCGQPTPSLPCPRRRCLEALEGSSYPAPSPSLPYNAVSEGKHPVTDVGRGIIIPESSDPQTATLIALARERWAHLQQRRANLPTVEDETLRTFGDGLISRAEFSVYRDAVALGVDVRKPAA